METYTALRTFADSWMVVVMTAFLIGVVIWVFRPGAKAAHDDAAQIPLRNDRLPDEKES
jgi:cytochrome c oxidase cbb3-type subunit 4